MSLTLVTNPVGTAASKIFAGFRPVEYIFKREDLAITGVSSGAGGITVTVATDISGIKSAGDSIYVYSEGAAYTYDAVGTIISITSTEIVVDIPFIQAGTGGYINYLDNYYVEMQLVDKTLSDSNILPFSLEIDGAANGEITIDVSLPVDKLIQRGEIELAALTDSNIEFEVKYREVYDGSSNSFTLIDNSLVVLVYATDTPETEEILNDFDMPKIYIGYPAGITVAHNGGSVGDNIEVTYDEADNNGTTLASGTLGTLDSGSNGFLQWKWDADTTIETGTKYIDFDFSFEAGFDFRASDFAHPDFLVQ